MNVARVSNALSRRWKRCTVCGTKAAATGLSRAVDRKTTVVKAGGFYRFLLPQDFAQRVFSSATRV